MKKIITLLLALILITSMSVSSVMAEEPIPEETPVAEGFTPAEEEPGVTEDYPLTEADTPSYEFKRNRPNMLPDLPFGTDLNEAAIKIRSQYEAGHIAITEDLQQDTITLSNGKQYHVISMTGENHNIENAQIITKLYGTDAGTVIGAVYEIAAESADFLSYFKEIISEVYIDPVPLTLDALGDFAELAGESAHLESGQDMWRYTYTGQNGIDPNNNTADNRVLSGPAIVTLRVIDNHAYIAEYLDPNQLAFSGAEASPINVEGFDKLGPNEQIAVRLYSEYLDKQYHEALQSYVNYLLSKNKQENAPSNEIME